MTRGPGIATLLAERATLDAAIAAAQGGGAAGVPGHDSSIADDDGLSPTLEEPMYPWIGSKPYAHRKAWRVLFSRVDGTRGYRAFETEAQAVAFIVDAQRYLVKDGRPVEDVIDAYVASQTRLRPSSRREVPHEVRGREGGGILLRLPAEQLAEIDRVAALARFLQNDKLCPRSVVIRTLIEDAMTRIRPELEVWDMRAGHG